MPYLTNIPASTDNLSVSQGQMQTNFAIANTNMNINHYPFTDQTTSAGKHKFVEMPILAAIPVTISGEGAIYTKTIGGLSELFYTRDNIGVDFQLTKSVANGNTLFGTNTPYVSSPVNSNTVSGGWCFIPGGLILQYGLVNIQNSPGTTLVTYPIPFPSGTIPFTIQVSAVVNSSTSGDQTASVRSLNAGTSFQIGSTSSGNVLQFYWMAIGK